MNIFFLDPEPELCAQSHSDTHVVKMIVETAQMLSTTLHVKGYGSSLIYKPTHANHPCTKWVGENWKNFDWTCELLKFLLIEYNFRYKKIHKTTGIYNNIMAIRGPVAFGILKDITSPALAMPDEFKIIDNPVDSYRNYYRIAKKDICKWNHNRPAPSWF